MQPSPKDPLGKPFDYIKNHVPASELRREDMLDAFEFLKIDLIFRINAIYYTLEWYYYISSFPNFDFSFHNLNLSGELREKKLGPI